MAIADKLTQLNNVKLAIKQALIDKKVNMTGIPFTDYASKIDEISFDILKDGVAILDSEKGIDLTNGWVKLGAWNAAITKESDGSYSFNINAAGNSASAWHYRMGLSLEEFNYTKYYYEYEYMLYPDTNSFFTFIPFDISSNYHDGQPNKINAYQTPIKYITFKAANGSTGVNYKIKLTKLYMFK